MNAPILKETEEKGTKLEEEPQKEVTPTPNETTPVPPKAPTTSLFSKSNKKKFARPKIPVQPVEEETPKEDKKKPIDKHANDDRTLFVGNLPSIHGIVVFI